MRVNVGALQGDGVNRARATSGALRSNEASARVKVVGGVFAEEAFVIGKVTLDCNRNGIQDEEAGEIGIPGVRLYRKTAPSPSPTARANTASTACVR